MVWQQGRAFQQPLGIVFRDPMLDGLAIMGLCVLVGYNELYIKPKLATAREKISQEGKGSSDNSPKEESGSISRQLPNVSEPSSGRNDHSSEDHSSHEQPDSCPFCGSSMNVQLQSRNRHLVVNVLLNETGNLSDNFLETRGHRKFFHQIPSILQFWRKHNTRGRDATSHTAT